MGWRVGKMGKIRTPCSVSIDAAEQGEKEA
jgi:hypothetical protein